MLIEFPQAAWVGQFREGKARPVADELYRAREGPRSRRAVGLGDVAGERGDH